MSVRDACGSIISSLIGTLVFCVIALLAPAICNSVMQSTPSWHQPPEPLISSQCNNQVTETLVIHQEAQPVHPYHNRFEAILDDEVDLGL
jgi:hypothetical protein